MNLRKNYNCLFCIFVFLFWGAADIEKNIVVVLSDKNVKESEKGESLPSTHPLNNSLFQLLSQLRVSLRPLPKPSARGILICIRTRLEKLSLIIIRRRRYISQKPNFK